MKRNELKIGIILSYVSIFLGFIISIIYTPYVLKVLGQNEYGTYQIVESLVSYISLLNFGFSSAYIRYYFKYKAQNDERGIKILNGIFFSVFFVIAIISVFIGIFMSFNIESILGSKFSSNDLMIANSLLLIMTGNIAITLLGTTFNVYILANEKFTFIKLSSLLRTIVGPLLVCFFLFLGYKSIGMAFALLLIAILFEVIIATYSIVRLDMKFIFFHFDMKLISEMTIFSSFIFLNMIIDQVNWNVDKFLLGRIEGPIEVAVYGVAAQINTYFMMFSTQISSVFVPRVNKLIALDSDRSEISQLFTQIGRIQYYVLFLVCTGFILVGQSFIESWVGKEYADAYWILIILFSTSLLPLIQNIGIEIQKSLNLHKFRTIIYLIGAIINILISIPLIHYYGPIGAALGTGIVMLILNGIVMNIYYEKVINLNMKYFFKTILSITYLLLIPFAIFLLISKLFVIEGLIQVFLFAGFYTLVYLIFLYFKVLDSFEKNLVNETFKKFRRS